MTSTEARAGFQQGSSHEVVTPGGTNPETGEKYLLTGFDKTVNEDEDIFFGKPKEVKPKEKRPNAL